jgi:hypothetical protein
MGLYNHYQLKIRLKDTNPVIWRRIHVSGILSLTDLHVAIQVAMGWEDEEIFEFEANKVIYSCDEDFVEENKNNPAQKVLFTDAVSIEDIIVKEKQLFTYIYDFDCNWEHDVFVEKIIENDTEFEMPYCLSGEGACPVEKIGGLTAYYKLLESFRDDKDDKHDDALDLLGDDFNPNKFDLKETNNYLVSVFDIDDEEEV